ncbi:acyltransferase family protein [Nonomuraea typhae]|uniref:acyltransferase family protein n=1 Tax=Nonomuraea typhae TaxID=2603600 RepID=UPI001FE27A09|nr:acyltransferase [Nonomuraea typhae]
MSKRLAWLDALRGLAAVLVVYEHAIAALWPAMHQASGFWFAAGWCGVMVFFLASGYIVPASLERRDNMRAFWIGRAFRLYPLWALCVAGALLLFPVTGSPLAHLSMLQDLLGVPSAVSVLWTLSYEMAFYLLVSALFTLGAHRRSTELALVLTAAALAGATLLPTGLLTGAPLVPLAVLAAGLAAVLSSHDRVRQAGAAVLLVAVVGLLAVNGRLPAWQSLIVVATMFSGTALYRAEQGQISWAKAWLVLAVPGTGVLLSPGTNLKTAFVAAWAIFLAGMALRGRPVPYVLSWLGLVSYSVYLLHPLLLRVLPAVWAVPATFALSALTWRWVEAPAQRLGRRLAARLAPDPS